MNYKDLKVMTIDEAMSNYDDKTEFCLEDEVYEMYQTYEEHIKELEEQLAHSNMGALINQLHKIIWKNEERIKELEDKLSWNYFVEVKPPEGEYVHCVSGNDNYKDGIYVFNNNYLWPEEVVEKEECWWDSDEIHDYNFIKWKSIGKNVYNEEK